MYVCVHIVRKGKCYPRTHHESPEKEQICSSTHCLTSELDGGG